MASLIVPVFSAASVALLVWFMFNVTSTLMNARKRRLQERLATDVREDAVAAAARSAIAQQAEITGISARMIKYPLFAGLNRRVIQAFPNMTVAQFVLFAAFFGMVALVVAMSLSSSIIIGAILGTGVAYVPVIILNAKRNRRQRAIALQLPEALDFLS